MVKINVTEIQKSNCKIWNIEFAKKLNSKVALENLSLIADFLNRDRQNIYCAFFGTLLGFVRNQNFIDHDEDTDIALFNPNDTFILNLKKSLIQKNFYIYRDDMLVLSAMRKGEYIDFYKFYSFNGYFQSDGFIFKEELFQNFTYINLTNNLSIRIPSMANEILTILYGDTWRIPIENHHASSSRDLKNTRLNSNFNLLLYNIYNKAKKNESLIGYLANSKITRFIILVYNKTFDFLFYKKK